MSSFIFDPRHWRERAEEARAQAEQMTDPVARDAMYRIAESYDLLVQRAEAREVGIKPR